MEMDAILRDSKRLTERSLVDLAIKHHVSPSALSRQALRSLLASEEPDGKRRNRLVSATLKDLARLDRIGLGWAKLPVRACSREDKDAGPVVDRLRREFGEALESELERRLDGMGIPYETEGSLRSKGARVTPDALLLVPTAVAVEALDSPMPDAASSSAASSSAGAAATGAVIINWIDSKAMFGCRESAAEHASQCSAYVREHGRGAVLYWFGVEQGVQEAMGSNVVVMTSLPRVVALPGGVMAAAGDIHDRVVTPAFIGGERLCAGTEVEAEAETEA
jgi:hypothetical protein